MKTRFYLSVHILLLAGLFLGGAARAQTFADDLLKVKAYFGGQTPIKASIEVRYFRNENDAAAAITKRGLLKRWGTDNYYSFFDGKEYLVNKKYTLFVDRARKLMVLKETNPDSKTRARELSVPEINKEQEAKYQISRAETDGKIIYTVLAKNNPQSHFKMELDRGGERLVRMVYYGGNSYARTEITYTYPQGEVVFAKNEFSEERYIAPGHGKGGKSQKTFVPAAAYAGYELNYQTR